MLAISSKLSEPVHWARPMTEYCLAAFGESGGVAQFLAAVDELRLEMAEGSKPHTIRRYLGALDMLEDKFPIGKSSALALSFVWGDSFRPRMKLKGNSVRFERAAVVFNLAASQSLLARDTDRGSAEGQKSAIASFQNAAGIFILLRDQIVPGSTDSLGPDMSDGAISMCASLMLAQAQALFYEKAVKDKSSKSLLAKLANQASNFYATATAHMAAVPLNTHLDPSWLAHCKFQELLFLAAAHFQQAMADKPNVVAKLCGFGPLVARLRLAREVANSVDSLALSPAVLTSINGLKEAIKTELTTIEYDNTNVYIEVVPDKANLLPIGLVPAVKAAHVSMSDLVDKEYLAGFASAIDGLAPPAIKLQAEQLEAQTARIAHQLDLVIANELRLDEQKVMLCAPAKHDSAALPDEVWSKIARVQVLGGPLGLEGQLVLLHSASGEAEALAASIARSMDEEEREDKACRDRFGAVRFNRASSAELTRSFRQQLSNYKSKLALAIETNKKVRDRIGAQDKGLTILLGKSRTELEAVLMEKNFNAQTLADPQMEHLKDVCRAHVLAAETYRVEAKAKVEAFGQKYVASQSVRIPQLLKAGANSVETIIGEAEQACGVLVEELRNGWTPVSEQFELAYQAVQEHDGTGGNSDNNWMPALTSCATVLLQGFSDVGEGLTFFGKLNDYLTKLKTQIEDYCFARNEEKSGLLQNIQRSLARDSHDGDAPQINFGQPHNH